jgi:dipeptidyl aminopeptidase/acylaminoacyl peptidase
MTTRDDFERTPIEFDRLMTAWFDAEALVREPVDLIDRTLARTNRMRPRPAWLLPERWLPMELTMRRFDLPRGARLLALLALLVAATIAVYALVGAPRARLAPFGLAANGVIPYVTDGGSVATVDPVSGKTTIVVPGSTQDLQRIPTYSRDGTRLAFVRHVAGGDAVFVVDAAGGTPLQVTAEPLAAVGGISWSADATRLAFVVVAHELWIASADGSGASRVDLGDVGPVLEATWRPPGNELIVAGMQDGHSRLFAVKPDGSGLRRVSPFDGGESDFQWLAPSPDGRQLAYGAFPGKQIHVVSLDAGTDRALQPIGGLGLNFPRWSPDGRRLAVLVVPDAGPTHVAVLDPAHATPEVVTTGPAFIGGVQFEWSPDGRSIIAVQWDKTQPWLLDPAGGPGRAAGWSLPNIDWIDWQRVLPSS